MQKKKIGIAALAAIITFLSFLRTLQNGFVNWDDNFYVYDNLRIRSLDLNFLRWAFSDYHAAANWHPLTWISHAVDYAVWGLNPLGHHLTNNLLHTFNTLLVVLLFARLLESARSRQAGTEGLLTDRGILIAAGFGGILFGIHPLHVESVAWISQRKDLLCALFYLLSIISYLKYADTEKQYAHSPFFLEKYYLLAVISFLLSSISKPMAVTLPVVLLLLDWYPLNRFSARSISKIVTEKAPFFAIAFIVAVLTVVAQKAAGTIIPMDESPLPERLSVALHAVLSYLGKMALPFDLSAFYPYPQGASFLSFEYFSAALAVAGLTIAAVYAAKKKHVWAAVWAFFILTLLPVIGIVRIGEQAMADRYSYLPSLGPFLLAGLAVAWLYRKFSERTHQGRELKAVLVLSASVLVLSLIYLTYQQIGIWRDGFTLWDSVIRKYPNVYLAYNNRGLEYNRRGLYDMALGDFTTTIALKPGYFKAYNNRGGLYLLKGDLDRALSDFNKTLSLNPGFEEAYLNRGIAFDRKGMFEEARKDFNRALSINPASYRAYINLGVALDRKGLLDAAIENYNKALSINPDSEKAYLNRGVVFKKKGLYQNAIEDYTRALVLNPGSKEACYGRAQAYFKMGLQDKAEEDLRHCNM